MDFALEKILNLAKKTGDNVIVFNPAQPDDSYVILAINSYEKLLNNSYQAPFLTDQDLADKINRDIAFWKNDQEADEEPFLADLKQEEAADNLEEEWEEEVNYLYPTEEEAAAESGAKAAVAAEPAGDFDSVSDILRSKSGVDDEGRNHWSIPRDRKLSAQSGEPPF